MKMPFATLSAGFVPDGCTEANPSKDPPSDPFVLAESVSVGKIQSAGPLIIRDAIALPMMGLLSKPGCVTGMGFVV
jgi:hypothetical protein